MKIADVPFYSNTPDGTHCVQASLRMVLKYFEPEKEFSWRELEQITAKVEGLSTWKSAMWIWLAEHNYDLHIIEFFNARRFIVEGGDYLKDEFGDEAAGWQIKMSNISQEQRLYKTLLENVPIENREPHIDDIETYLDRGYLVCAAVNSKMLARQPGYVGHSIVITGYDKDIIIINNPGLPARENQVVSRDDFELAWASPNVMAKEMFAVKFKTQK
jgi:hypothetical protein